MDNAKLREVLRLHVLYLRGEPGGCRANLRDADLGGAYLRGADLRDADLGGADLGGANLGEIDAQVPKVEHLEQRILAAIEAGGKLDMGNWHKCQTTHCRAGWAITLGGEAGAALETKLGPATAGALIYFKSVGYVPDFYAPTSEALADIRTRAGAVSDGEKKNETTP